MHHGDPSWPALGSGRSQHRLTEPDGVTGSRGPRTSHSTVPCLFSQSRSTGIISPKPQNNAGERAGPAALPSPPSGPATEKVSGLRHCHFLSHVAFTDGSLALSLAFLFPRAWTHTAPPRMSGARKETSTPRAPSKQAFHHISRGSRRLLLFTSVRRLSL